MVFGRHEGVLKGRGHRIYAQMQANAARAHALLFKNPLARSMSSLGSGVTRGVRHVHGKAVGQFRWVRTFAPANPLRKPPPENPWEDPDKPKEQAATAAERIEQQQNVKPHWFYAWAYRNINFGRYEPFDEEIQRTDIEYYEPPWYIKYTDKFARRMDKAGETMPEDLPPTWCGAIMSFLFTGLATMLLYNSVSKLFSSNTSLVGWGAIALNVDYICDHMRGYESVGMSREYKERIMPNGDPSKYNVPGCSFNELYFSDFPRMAKKPYLDVPVLEFDWRSTIEFYEEDGKSSLSKIEWKDKTGLHFGGTSMQGAVPVAFGAHEKLPIMLNSYPYGASDVIIESPMPNMTRYIREMSVTSSTHNFDESLRYAYSDLGLMGSHDAFFNHDVVAFVRFDPKQMRDIKSCQVQVGLGSRYQYDALRPYLLQYNREYQKKNMLDTFVTGNWSWHPTHYTNSESGSWRRRESLDNMMILKSGWTADAARRFMQNVAYGKYQVNVERRMREFGVDTGYNTTSGQLNRDVAVPTLFTDWMIFATYVNNFQYSSQTIVCDGKLGQFFNAALVKAEPPDKHDKVITLKTPVVLWTRKFPFYITVTGDMGVEKMLVTSKVDSLHIKVVRGTAIGSSRLNFKTARPASYPAVASDGLWVCPISRYMDGEYCDCNCGMTDPDCLPGTLPVKYCAESEICSPLGRCTTPIYNSTGSEVAVSEGCTSMTLPGEVLLDGYLGHPDDFAEQGGDACWVCPYDVLYEGKTSKNENNEYVCQYRPEGDIPARDGALAFDAQTVATYGNSTTSAAETLGAYRIVRVNLGPKAGFPVQGLLDTNFTVELNYGQGITELVSVLQSEPVDSKTKTQVLHLKSTGTSFRYQHFASGTMVSAMTGDYKDTVLQLDDDNQPFSTSGPYRILIDSSEIQVRTGSGTVSTSTTTTTTTTAASSRRRLSAAGSEMPASPSSSTAAAANKRFTLTEEEKMEAKRRRLEMALNKARQDNVNEGQLNDEEPVGDFTGDSEAAVSLSRADRATSTAYSATSALSAFKQEQRRLTTASTADAVDNTTACGVKTPKRQRLDIAAYANGLESAGVKSILARQYTASLRSDISVFGYPIPDETAGSTQLSARHLYFSDSSLASVSGGVNCFTDIYDTPFASTCRVAARQYSMYIVLQTPPATSSGTINAANAWTATAGGKDAVSNADVGYTSDTIKEVLRQSVAETFGLGVTGIKPDVQALADTSSGNAIEIAAPSPAAPAEWTGKVASSTRQLLLQVKFRTRQWYEINKKMDPYLLPDGDGNTTFPESSFISIANAKFRNSTVLQELYAGSNYDANNAATNPKNDGAQDFDVKFAGELVDLSASASGSARRLTEAEMLVDEDHVKGDEAARRSLGASSGGSVTLWDFTADWSFLVTKAAALTTAESIASSAAFTAKAVEAFVYAVTQGGITTLTSNAVELAAYGFADATAANRANLRLVYKVTKNALGKEIVAATNSTTFLTDMATKLVEHADVASVLGMQPTSESLAPQAVENADAAPAKVDFDTLDSFQQIKGDKPWCDYSTLTGSPGVDEDGTAYSGRKSIFCDGLHDGVLVVNYAGFSDPTLIPKDNKMSVMIRGGSANPSTPSAMEVRTMTRAYQWLWPEIDPSTGKIGANRVAEWRCEAAQWADGICDCNCGRADWDCMGDRGIPELYVQQYLDDATSTVNVNVNCPDGEDALVPVPELAPGELPPTCGAVQRAPATYAYCEYKTGLPTSVRERAFTYGTEFNGTMLAAPLHMKYLWEVLELDCPLLQSRDAGTIVESLGVSETTATVYKWEAKKVTEAYVDTSLMESDYDLEEEEEPNLHFVIDPACVTEDPPPFCTGGAVNIGGEEIQTLPVVRARMVLETDSLPAGTLGEDLLQDEDVIEAFQLALAGTFQVKSYEVRIRSFTVASARALTERWKAQKQMSTSSRTTSSETRTPYVDRILSTQERENVTRIKAIRLAQLLTSPESEKRRRQLTAANTKNKILVEFETSQSNKEQALLLYSRMQKATAGTRMQAQLSEFLLEVTSPKVAGLQVSAVTSLEAVVKMPNIAALEAAVEAAEDAMSRLEVASLQIQLKDVEGFDMNVFDVIMPGIVKTGTKNSASSAGSGSNFLTCFDECCFKGTTEEMTACASGTWMMTGASCCPNGLETYSEYSSYSTWGYATAFEDPFYVEPGKCCYDTALSDTDKANCCNTEVGFTPCCPTTRRQLGHGPDFVSPETDAQVLRRKQLEQRRARLSAAGGGGDKASYGGDGALLEDSAHLYQDEIGDVEDETVGASSPSAAPRRTSSAKTVDELFEQLVSKYPWMSPELARAERHTHGRKKLPDAQIMAEQLREYVFNDGDWQALMRKHGAKLGQLRRLGLEIPDYTRPLTEKELQMRRRHAGEGNDHRRRLRDAVLNGELDVAQILDTSRKGAEDGSSLAKKISDLKSSISRVRAVHKNLLEQERQAKGKGKSSSGRSSSTSSRGTRWSDGSEEQDEEGDDEVEGRTRAASSAASYEAEHLHEDGLAKSASYTQLQTDWAAIEREWMRRNYRHMLPDATEDVLNYQLSAAKWAQLATVVDEAMGARILSVATTRTPTSSGGEDGSSWTSSSSSKRILTASSNSTNTTVTTEPPLNQTDCTLDWTDESNWPPNARIHHVPQCAHGLLSQAQLEQLGFFDQVHLTTVSGDVNDAISAFAGAVSQLIPSKKVVSFVVQTLSMINLFRDASSMYLPKDRYKRTPLENYESPAVLDAHVGIFVYPDRRNLTDLCPSNAVNGELISNFFATGGDANAANWNKLAFHPTENLQVRSCEVHAFGAAPINAGGPETSRQQGAQCKTAEQMKTDSVDRYRLYCMEDFLPANVMRYKIEGPLTGHWMVSAPRTTTEYDTNKPEYALDLEMIYHMSIDSQFLAVEKDYKGGQTDYTNGVKRLWAAEALARGRAVCTDVIKGCAEGIPANPPMLLPGIGIRVNKEKTKTLLGEVAPLHWPLPGTLGLDTLLEELDNLDLDIMPGLRQLTSAEDGYVGIKPMTKVLIRVLWQVNPIYFVNKWHGGIALTRWVNSVKGLDISFQQADYTMKSSASVRLIFEIDGSSLRFQEVPLLSFSDFLALLGAYAGYTGLLALVLGAWQKLVKPFGLVDFYYADNEYANVVDRWYAKKMIQLGFQVPEDKEGEDGGDGENANEEDAGAVDKEKQDAKPRAIEDVQVEGEVSMTQHEIEAKIQEQNRRDLQAAEDAAKRATAQAAPGEEPEPATPPGVNNEGARERTSEGVLPRGTSIYADAHETNTPPEQEQPDPLPIMDAPQSVRIKPKRTLSMASMADDDDLFGAPVRPMKKGVSSIDDAPDSNRPSGRAKPRPRPPGIATRAGSTESIDPDGAWDPSYSGGKKLSP